MIYRRVEDKANSSSLEISEYNVGKGVAEYNLIIKVSDHSLVVTDQIECLNKACKKFMENEAGRAKPAFKRFFIKRGTDRSYFMKKETDYPVSVIEQPPLDGSLVTLWVYLRTDIISSKESDNLFVASNNGYDHYWFVNGRSNEMGTDAETYDIMSAYTKHLGSVGATLADNCLRTWIFVDDIDNNYGTMVDARNIFFEKEGLTAETHYIASTGIDCSMGTPSHSVQMDAYAVCGIQKEQVTFLKGSSHLNPTFEYGVSFERGTKVEYGDRRHVIISGTASINNYGMIVGPGDISGQIQRTIENIDVLLSEAGCGFGDVAHMLVYLRNREDYETVDSYFMENFGDIPMVILHAPVCRKGWLIEIECMAIKKGGSEMFPVL